MSGLCLHLPISAEAPLIRLLPLMSFPLRQGRNWQSATFYFRPSLGEGRPKLYTTSFLTSAPAPLPRLCIKKWEKPLKEEGTWNGKIRHHAPEFKKIRLNGFQVGNSEVKGKKLYLELYPSRELRPRCRYCNSREVWSKGWTKRTLRHLDVLELESILKINHRRYRCQQCGNIFNLLCRASCPASTAVSLSGDE